MDSSFIFVKYLASVMGEHKGILVLTLLFFFLLPLKNMIGHFICARSYRIVEVGRDIWILPSPTTSPAQCRVTEACPVRFEY